MTHRQLGAVVVPDPRGEAVVLRARDGFADPPGLAVREDVLAAVGGPERVRAGALADLVARIEAAGHAVEVRAGVPAPRRVPTPAALHREGSGRFWLFRRHPDRYPLPLAPSWRLPFLAFGALRANALPRR